MDAIVRQKGQITIPATIRHAACVQEGDLLDVRVRGGCIIMQPVHQNGDGVEGADSFLMPEWLERIDRSIAELEAGLGRVFESEDEFFASLDE